MPGWAQASTLPAARGPISTHRTGCYSSLGRMYGELDQLLRRSSSSWSIEISGEKWTSKASTSTSPSSSTGTSAPDFVGAAIVHFDTDLAVQPFR